MDIYDVSTTHILHQYHNIMLSTLSTKPSLPMNTYVEPIKSTNEFLLMAHSCMKNGLFSLSVRNRLIVESGLNRNLQANH